MSVCRIVVFCGLSLLLAAASPDPCSGAEADEASPEAVTKILESFRPTQLSIDRLGNPWAWNRDRGVVRAITGDGKIEKVGIGSDAVAVDFDPVWGVVVLGDEGWRIEVHSRDQESKSTLELPSRAGDVVWIDPGRVAVSPVRSSSLVEVWKVTTGEKLRTFGSARPVPIRVGTLRLRHVLLDFDHERRRLHTLETFTGEVATIDLDEEKSNRLQLPEGDRDQLDTWLQDQDRQSRERGDTREVFLNRWSGMARDSKGSVWVAEDCDRESQRLALIEIGNDGALRQKTLEGVECCSYTFTLWNDWLILYREPGMPLPNCTEFRRFL